MRWLSILSHFPSYQNLDVQLLLCQTSKMFVHLNDQASLWPTVGALLCYPSGAEIPEFAWILIQLAKLLDEEGVRKMNCVLKKLQGGRKREPYKFKFSRLVPREHDSVTFQLWGWQRYHSTNWRKETIEQRSTPIPIELMAYNGNSSVRSGITYKSPFNYSEFIVLLWVQLVPQFPWVYLSTWWPLLCTFLLF